MEPFDFFDLMFVSGPVLKMIYSFGFKSKKEVFLEMTAEQYKKYYETEKDTGERMYLYLPKDPKEYAVVAGGKEVFAVAESDIELFDHAWQIVERYCQGKDLQDDEGKLAYTATRLPDVFTEGTHFELYSKGHYVYHGRQVFRGLHDDDMLLLSDKQRDLFGGKEPVDLMPEYYVLKVNAFNDVAKDSLDEWISFLKTGDIPEHTTAKGLDEARERLRVDKLP